MKFPSFFLLFSLLGWAVGCSGPQTGEPTARRSLEASAEAMGGWDALRNAHTQRLVSEGSEWEPFQAFRPGENLQVNRFTSTLTLDYSSSSIRLELQADMIHPRVRSQQFTEVINGGLGMLEQAETDGTLERSRLHSSRTATRLRDLNRTPVRVLLTASQASALTRLPDETADGVSYQVLEYRDFGQAVRLRLESSTSLPASVAYLEDDPVQGDTWNEIRWSDWRPLGDLKLPYALEQRVNGLIIRKETFQTIQNNPPVAPQNDFAIPEEIRQAPEVGEPVVSQWVLRRVAMGASYLDFTQSQKAPLQAVAPGVWLATGAGHQTLVIEMSDHLMLVEAPLYDERSLAVIQAVKEKFSAKPIRYIVMTHHHNDHSGGIRTYVAEGATVVAHSSLLPFLRTVFTSPKTVRPDSLARLVAGSGKQPEIKLEGVDKLKEYTDGTRVVRLYPVTPNPHAESLLLVYLPGELLTFAADLVTPDLLSETSAIETRAFAYYDFVKKNGLQVDRIGRVHGEVIPFRNFAAKIEQARREENNSSAR